jgi:Cysteine-rich CWC
MDTGNFETLSVPAIDTARCPLCGNLNACAIAAGSKDPCWCTNVHFSEELLASVPPEARDRVCICAACAVAAIENPES